MIKPKNENQANGNSAGGNAEPPANGNGAGEDPPPPSPTDDSKSGPLGIAGMAGILIIISAVVIYLWVEAFGNANESYNAEFNVQWNAPDSSVIILKPGPPSFYYDRTNHFLYHHGRIDAEKKKVLIQLIEDPMPGRTHSLKIYNEFRQAINELAEKSSKDRSGSKTFASEWNAPSDLNLKQGPPSFKHDQKNNKLTFKGSITEKIRRELLELLEYPKAGYTHSLKVLGGYRSAIDQLAYQSNKINIGLNKYLFILAGLSGIIGVMLRSLGSFIGTACYKQSFSFIRWWPYYIVRPMSGIIIGTLSLVIIKAGIPLVIENRSATSFTEIYWWMFVAFIAGFAASDFIAMLQNISKRVFGTQK